MDILTLDSVSKHFGGLQAIRDVTCGIPEGTVTSLIGPNGAGKSTLTSLICGIHKPSHGRILLRGRAIHGLPPHVIKRLGVARTFQIVQLFSNMTVLQNVQIGAHVNFGDGWLGALPRLGADHREKEIAGRCMELLRFLGIDSYANSMPSDLPFGHQRTVELARALVAEPTVLIMDEPCSGLAHGEVEHQLRIIDELRGRGVTILFIEHNMSVVMEISDKIIVLNYGEKLAEGSPQEIMNNPQVIQAYLGEEMNNASS